MYMFYLSNIKLPTFQEQSLRNTPVVLQLHEKQHQGFPEAMSWLHVYVNECLPLLWLKEIPACLLNKITAAYLKWSSVDMYTEI